MHRFPTTFLFKALASAVVLATCTSTTPSSTWLAVCTKRRPAPVAKLTRWPMLAAASGAVPERHVCLCGTDTAASARQGAPVKTARKSRALSRSPAKAISSISFSNDLPVCVSVALHYPLLRRLFAQHSPTRSECRFDRPPARAQHVNCSGIWQAAIGGSTQVCR